MSSDKILLKKGPLKTFLFFLGFSAIIWVFMQFSKDYTEVMELPITYINVPKDKILLDSKPKTLQIRIKDKGFNLALHKIVPPTIKIDMNEAVEKKDQLVFDLQQQKQAILAQLNLDYENASFLQPSLNIDFQQRGVKTLKVVSNINFSFAVGYSALKPVVLQPDSVKVSGPKKILDTLSQISTKSLRITNVSKDLEGSVALDTSGLGNVNLYTQEVSYRLSIDKFTEGKVKIPIETTNVPDNSTVVIFPKEVLVYYQVSLKKFDLVKPMDFRVVVDLKNARDGDGYLIAQVVQQPDIVTNVRLNEKKIQFVIKK